MKIKIITVAGSGRSGSTLVALLLSQHKQTFNLGQMRHLASAWLANAPCSCGRTLQDCAIYAPVVRSVFGPEPIDKLPVFQAGLGKLLKDVSQTRHWGDEDTRNRLANLHSATLGQVREIVDAVGQQTGARMFVDSSKMPEMALVFDLAFPGAVVVLNLLRDPRAVACSWHLKRASYVSTYRNMRVWSKRQVQLEAWRPSLGDRFLALKYEDFAAHPSPAIAPAFAAAGLAMPGDLFPEPQRAAASWAHQHIFPPANETVLRERLADIPIRRSDGWKNRKNRRLHMLAIAATWPLGRKYYPAHNDTSTS